MGNRIKKLWRDFKRLKKSELQMLVLVLAGIGIMGWIGTAIQTDRVWRAEEEVSRLSAERDVAVTRWAELLDVAYEDETEAQLVREINEIWGTPEYHKVVKGECLWRIAERYYGNGEKWRHIYELNKDQIQNPDLIYPGQIFKVYDVRTVMQDWEVGC